MTTIERGPSLEQTLRDYLRLRKKHPVKSPEGRSYREAIREAIARLRAFRLAQQANHDLVLPPLKRPFKHRRSSHSDSVN